jgi:hypothetical protein
MYSKSANSIEPHRNRVDTQQLQGNMTADQATSLTERFTQGSSFFEVSAPAGVVRLENRRAEVRQSCES